MSYDNFPEVYHTHGITTPPFTGAERPVTGQGANTIYRRKISLWRSTYCVFRPLRAGAVPEDPELAFFGSKEERRRICADNAILMINIEHNRTIAYLVTIIKNICIIFSKRTRLLFPM